MNLKHIKTNFQLIVYFVILGVIITITISIVNYNTQFNNINKTIHKNATHILSCKQEKIKYYINNIEKQINALSENEIFKNYLQKNSKENTQNLQNLLIHVANGHEHYFQVRFISKKGLELIRIDKNNKNNKSFSVSKRNLQDRSKQYYFKETATLAPNMFWYSKLDLNRENSKIEYPLRPTFRIAKPIYYNKSFCGIIIINIDMSYLIKQLTKTPNFDLFLVDKKGNFLIHTNNKYNWSQYLNTNYNFIKLFPQYKKLLQQNKFHNDVIYSTSVEHLFKNNESIKIILKTQDKYLNSLLYKNYKLILYLGLIILIVSIPIAMLIAVYHTRIQKKLQSTISENKKYLDIIDKYVITVSTDLQGNIKHISNAMCNISKFTKEEIIGEKISIVKSGLMNSSFYNSLWSTILKGKSWSGEIQNKSKDNQFYWLKMDILPQFDEDNKLYGFTSISTDITIQKTIEKISQEDTLTKIYNRLKIEEILQYEINRMLRTNITFSIILIGIDYFKSINDTFGHIIGDKVLIEFAQLLKSNIRTIDHVGRWGGKEFIIICPDTDLNGTINLAESIRKEIESFHFHKVGYKTVSFGVGSCLYNENLVSLINRTNQALYEAKSLKKAVLK